MSANPITEIVLDSYACTNCGGWMHDEQPTTDDIARPEYCPYCGHQSLIWRTDNNWRLLEVSMLMENSGTVHDHDPIVEFDYWNAALDHSGREDMTKAEAKEYCERIGIDPYEVTP